MYGDHPIFPHRVCSAKGPPGCPGRELNPGPTEWQAGGLTIKLRLTPSLSYTSPIINVSLFIFVTIEGHLCLSSSRTLGEESPPGSRADI